VKNKGWGFGGVAQGIGPEFKSQYQKNPKKPLNRYFSKEI
jgi:hypothetical protein